MWQPVAIGDVALKRWHRNGTDENIPFFMFGEEERSSTCYDESADRRAGPFTARLCD